MGQVSRGKYRVLISDESPAARQVVGSLLAEHYHISLVSTVEDVLPAVENKQIDLVLLDAPVPAVEGYRDIIGRIHALRADLPVFIFAPGEPPDAAVFGAADAVSKDLLQSEAGRTSLVLRIDRAITAWHEQRESAIRRRQNRRAASAGSSFLVGQSAAVAAIREEIARLAASDLNLLLTGETGVGKTLIAELVHNAAGRAAAPFVVVEPSTLPPSLFESELFGHARGAFTGAAASHIGAFEAANGGTLFLDEIGDLQAPLQVKMLRAAETKRIRRVGESKEFQLDVRLITATNRDLESDVGAGRFRDDLFQRLNQLRVHIPPLRERPEDVAPLLQHFLLELNLESDAVCSIAADAEKALRAYRWPGNVRELRTLARRLMERGMPAAVTAETLLPVFPARVDRGAESDLPPAERVQALSRRIYLEELSKNDYSIRVTARALGLAYGTLYSRLKSLGLLEVAARNRKKDKDS